MKRTLIYTSLILVSLILLSPAILADSPDKENNGKGADKSKKVELQILAINDFHGNIASSFSGNTLGGADYLTTHLRELEATNRNTVIVSAGDLIGASPLISALFHDEPTIEAANLFGLDLNAVGNHEFDEGAAELLRMQYGGCHPVDGCQDGDDFDGARFSFLAANVVDHESGQTIFPAFKIKNFQGVKVAFIGMTLEGTPSIVTPSGVAGLDFKDEADTVNALILKLRKTGVEAIVVLIHEGGFQSLGGGANDCNGISGPIVDIIERTDDAVDLFITGHTHQSYNCVIDGRPVTSASSFGRLFTKIDVELNRVTKEMTVVAIDNRSNTRNVVPAADVTALIAKYDALSAPLANRVIGSITQDITRNNNVAGESALGDVIADAQLAATAPAGFGEAVVAFMNPGGIRADLLYLASGSEADGEVTYGEAFTVQPFGNSLVTMSLTGAQIDTLLEQQFQGCGTQTANRVLQVSAGFTYSWSLSAPACNRVDPTTIQLNGVTVDPSASYRLTVNSFLADGGDNFAVLTAGTDRLGGDLDLDALEVYFAANSPVAPGPQDRITQLP